jgi:hypothetical protein
VVFVYEKRQTVVEHELLVTDGVACAVELSRLRTVGGGGRAALSQRALLSEMKKD